MKRIAIIHLLFLGCCLQGIAAKDIYEVDVCVYGATPSGILAAYAVHCKGRSVVIVEPGRWVGGILGAGIKPMQDCPNFDAVGGMTRTLLKTLGQPLDGPRLGQAELRPEQIRKDFLSLLCDRDIQVIYDHRIGRCIKDGPVIRELFFDLAPFDDFGCPPEEAQRPDHLQVRAKIYIDAGYNGDLLACSGVSFRVGRESTDEYGEEMAGVRELQHLTPIDPFAEPGNPDRVLLPLVEDDHGKPVGAADNYIQAYNYRFYVATDPEYRIPFEPPAGYQPRDFELVGRYVTYLKGTIPNEEELFEALRHIFPGWRNAADYNYYRGLLFTMAPVGISQRYAGGDYAEKSRIWKQHQDYLRGLHYFLSTDPRVPEAFREETARLGLDRRPHPDTHGWPHQLYIRASRRMVGRYTVTANDVYNRTKIDDSIGLAQYGIDTYPSRRIWLKRDDRYFVALEGNMFLGGARGPTNTPYPIPYRAITPKSDECTNLLVPVCFSASHLGYASARMEPVFMICGESAGIAAVHAMKENKPVQDIDMPAYRNELLKANQRLAWIKGEANYHGSTSGKLLEFRKVWNKAKKGWEWLYGAIRYN
jgi:hypothetical protein